MQTSQSVQSLCDNAPKKVLLADGGSSANTLGFLLQWMSFCFAAVFFNFGFLSEPFKRKMYDKTDESLYWKQSTLYKYKRTPAEIVWGNECLSFNSNLRFSPVAPYDSDHWRSFLNFNWQQNAKVWKSNTSSTFVYL